MKGAMRKLWGGMAAALLVMGPVSAASPDPFDTSLTDGFMVNVNDAISTILGTMDIPISGFGLEFATLSGTNLLTTTMGTGFIGNSEQVTPTTLADPLLFADGMTIDGPNSGANWQAENPLDTDTYLGGAGFNIGLSSVGTPPQIDCLAVNMSFGLSAANLLSFGVPQDAVTWLFDPANSPEAVSAAFFEQFTYYKVFTGANPAIASPGHRRLPCPDCRRGRHSARCGVNDTYAGS